MKVMKFGGGCLKDAESVVRVAEIIRSERTRPVIVVSAVSGVTDRLLESLLKAQSHERNIPLSIRQIQEVHLNLIQKTVNDQEVQKEVFQEIERYLKKVEKLLFGIAYTGEATPAVRSHVLSFGERMAALILSAVLRCRGMESRPMESDRIGLVTDDTFENATVNLKEFKKRFRPFARSIAKGKSIPVITGFFGCTPDGKTATFGRNGTDYSAAVIACGLQAEELEIWKDVDGFMSTDPKIVPRASKIDRLSYYEAAELSYFGARILHPRTLEPLTGMKISVRIKNIFDPQSPGTEIRPQAYVRKDVVKSVTFNRQIALLRIHGPGVGYKPGIIGQVGRMLSTIGINIYSILTSQTCINLLIDKKDARRSYEALRELQGGVIERVDLNEDVALIAAVGEGLLRKKGLAARIFSAVSRVNVNMEMISTGASEVASYFVIGRADTEKVIRALHREFFIDGSPVS
ncbi:MAG: aspartate kinase [Candidatus Aminicenantales bacterium]